MAVRESVSGSRALQGQRQYGRRERAWVGSRKGWAKGVVKGREGGEELPEWVSGRGPWEGGEEGWDGLPEGRLCGAPIGGSNVRDDRMLRNCAPFALRAGRSVSAKGPSH